MRLLMMWLTEPANIKGLGVVVVVCVRLHLPADLTGKPLDLTTSHGVPKSRMSTELMAVCRLVDLPFLIYLLPVGCVVPAMPLPMILRMGAAVFTSILGHTGLALITLVS